MSKLLSTERKDRIVDYLSKHQRATVKELSQMLDVTEVTLRSDLKVLEQDGFLKRFHGGATIKDQTASENNFLVRGKKNRLEKMAIGKEAATLVEDGQCILLDGSTTSLELAHILKKKQIRLTVITNGIHTAMELKDNPEFTVILIGGVLRIGSITIEGTLGSNILEKINVDTMFTSAHGFTIEEGLTDFNVYEVELKKMMVSKAPNIVALLDYSKIGKSSIATFAATEQVDTIITDSKTSRVMIDTIQQQKIHVRVVDSRD